ncbi:MAG: hypothetical protein MN733_14410 [Nitrososphaera sp.]|nr:hypothetical protein [Nitrososphaera sp.]
MQIKQLPLQLTTSEMGGVKRTAFKGSDIDEVNIQPDLGEIQFYLKDGRVARKYLKAEHIRKIIAEIGRERLHDRAASNRIFDLIDSLER